MLGFGRNEYTKHPKLEDLIFILLYRSIEKSTLLFSLFFIFEF